MGMRNENVTDSHTTARGFLIVTDRFIAVYMPGGIEGIADHLRVRAILSLNIL